MLRGPALLNSKWHWFSWLLFTFRWDLRLSLTKRCKTSMNIKLPNRHWRGSRHSGYWQYLHNLAGLQALIPMQLFGFQIIRVRKGHPANREAAYHKRTEDSDFRIHRRWSPCRCFLSGDLDILWTLWTLWSGYVTDNLRQIFWGKLFYFIKVDVLTETFTSQVQLALMFIVDSLKALRHGLSPWPLSN